MKKKIEEEEKEECLNKYAVRNQISEFYQKSGKQGT